MQLNPQRTLHAQISMHWGAAPDSVVPIAMSSESMLCSWPLQTPWPLRFMWIILSCQGPLQQSHMQRLACVLPFAVSKLLSSLH